MVRSAGFEPTTTAFVACLVASPRHAARDTRSDEVILDILNVMSESSRVSGDHAMPPETQIPEMSS